MFLDESGIDETYCSGSVASGRKITGAIRFLVNGSETMLWKEKEISRIRAV